MNSIFHRVSIRKYQDTPVESEKIDQILRAGMQAPSAMNQQPWEFYVVRNKEKIQELSTVSPYSKCAAGAPVVLVSVMRKHDLKIEAYAMTDVAICMENIWLETDAQGLGGVWYGIAPHQEMMDHIGQILNLPKDVEAFAMFSLGYPAESRPQKDRYEAERIHFVD